jgi:large subunit ribosomal protein L10
LERAKKEMMVHELRDKLQRVNSLFVTEYTGLNVEQMSRVRRELRGAQAEFKVVKNTLMRIAARGTRGEELEKFFYGQNAIISVYGDPVGVAKILTGFMKEMPQLKFKVGLLGQRVITGEEFQKLSQLPSREILLGSLVGLLGGMPVRLLFALQWNLCRLLLTLNAIRSKKENSKEA